MGARPRRHSYRRDSVRTRSILELPAADAARDEQINLGQYDLVISNSHAFAKGVVGPGPSACKLRAFPYAVRLGHAARISPGYEQHAGSQGRDGSNWTPLPPHLGLPHREQRVGYSRRILTHRSPDTQDLWARRHGNLPARRCQRLPPWRSEGFVLPVRVWSGPLQEGGPHRPGI